MNGKEKFMFVMLLALYIGAFYYYAMTEELKLRMDELNLADKEHVDKVLGAYSDSLHTISRKFLDSLHIVFRHCPDTPQIVPR